MISEPSTPTSVRSINPHPERCVLEALLAARVLLTTVLGVPAAAKLVNASGSRNALRL